MAELKFYTLNEAAEILSVTRRTVYNYVKAGKLHAGKAGGIWRVSEEDIRRFAQGDAPADQSEAETEKK